MNLNKEHEKHRTERPPRVGPRGDRDVPAPTGAQRPGSAQEPPGDVVVVTAQRRRQGRGERCGDVGSAACPSPRRRYRSLCPQGRGGSSVSGDSRGIAMRMPNGGEVVGGQGPCPPPTHGGTGTPLLCCSASSRKPKAPPRGRGCGTGEPPGVQSGGPCGHQVSGGGDVPPAPRSWGARAMYGGGRAGCAARGEPAPRDEARAQGTRGWLRGRPRARGDAGCGSHLSSLDGVQVWGSVGELRMGGQPPLAPPVRLPKGSGELLQLRAQRQVDVQVHAQGFQPLLQLAKGRPEERGTCGTWCATPCAGSPPSHTSTPMSPS